MVHQDQGVKGVKGIVSVQRVIQGPQVTWGGLEVGEGDVYPGPLYLQVRVMAHIGRI